MIHPPGSSQSPSFADDGYHGDLRFRFVTSTPFGITRGSGTFVGITVLASALKKLGHTVDYESPTRHFPIYTLERLWFNRSLRPSPAHDLTIGFDMDGYRIAGPGHIASLKGVIADEVRFERGLTRATMGVQARCERLHVRRAERVLVTSGYSADRACEFYGLKRRPAIVPELIDLASWRQHLAEHPATASRFTVLYVGRFYLRKRVDVLLRAAAILRRGAPDLEVRIVGNGPCNEPWRNLSRDLKLDANVTWLGDVSRAQMAEEYNRCHVFCLPSVQEGFGIVLLEAMAAGKPIVAARAGAAPEAAPHATLAAPDNPEALAEALRKPGDPTPGLQWVEQFDAARVATRFLEAVTTGR
jgi:glycosyltransferase involved in cell wall biosynthesis